MDVSEDRNTDLEREINEISWNKAKGQRERICDSK